MSYMDEFEATNFMLMEDNATMYDIIETPSHNNQCVDSMSYYNHPQYQQEQEEYQSTIDTTTVDSSANPINSNDDNDEKYDENDADNDELIKNNSHASVARPDNVECLTNITKSDKSDVVDNKQLIA